MSLTESLKVVILCGGQGTRLREETEYRPKPMVEIGGRPILWHIMKMYAHHGFQDFVLCLGYKGNIIKEYFLNYESMTNDFTVSLGKRQSIEYHNAHSEQDFRVTLSETGPLTQTGGRIKRVERFIDADLFLCTYGDGLADLNVREVVAFHRQHGKLATMTAVRPTSRYGVVNLTESGNVSRFAEKPQAQGWVNAGFFVFDRLVFEYLKGDECVLEREPLERLSQEGQLMAYRHDGMFMAMDTFREYTLLNNLWQKGEAFWKIWT